MWNEREESRCRKATLLAKDDWGRGPRRHVDSGVLPATPPEGKPVSSVVTQIEGQPSETLPVEKRKGRLKKKKGNAPKFDLREGLFRLTGTDLTRIDGIDVMTATTVISEAGFDTSKWETEHDFVSWLRLCPDNRISGEKIIGKGGPPTNNGATIALKMAARRSSPGAPGDTAPDTCPACPATAPFACPWNPLS